MPDSSKQKLSTPHPRERAIKKLVDTAVSDFLTDYPVDGSKAVLLDIGCGTQPYRSLVEAAGFSYRSLDTAQSALVNVDFIKSVTEPNLYLNKQTTSVDRVLCTEVLEHVSNPVAAMANIYNLLRPGGTALLTTPFFYPVHEAPHDYYRFTQYALQELAEQAGFVVESLRTEGCYSEVLGTLISDAYSISSSANLVERANNFFSNVALNFLRKQIQNGGLIQGHADIYLSNILVLRR